jgi:hypothetical protein
VPALDRSGAIERNRPGHAALCHLVDAEEADVDLEEVLEQEAADVAGFPAVVSEPMNDGKLGFEARGPLEREHGRLARTHDYGEIEVRVLVGEPVRSRVDDEHALDAIVPSEPVDQRALN